MIFKDKTYYISVVMQRTRAAHGIAALVFLMRISFRQGMPAAFQNMLSTDRIHAVAAGTVTVSFPPWLISST